MAQAHMTKLGWYEVELDKLIALGYSSGEAHKIVIGRLESIGDSIEWWDGNPIHNENKHDDNKEVWAWWY